MTIPEQVGKVAGGVVDGLKANPSCLAALAIVALFAVLQYFDDTHQNQRMQQRAEVTAKLLEECIRDANADRHDQR